jgi:ParB family chromosome partitioning protein
LRQLDGTSIDLTPEEQAAIEALNAEHDKLEAEYQRADKLPDEVDARLGEIETALLALEDRPQTFDPAEIARAGVFVSIARDGTLCVDRGYVHPEDEPPSGIEPHSDGAYQPGDHGAGEPASPAVQRAVITIGSQAETEEEEDDAIKPLPDRLVSELTAYRTLALRDAVASNPQVAMTALLHKLCLDTFHHGLFNSCLDASVREVSFPIQPADLKDSLPAKAVDERQEAWSADVPEDEAALWDWLDTLDDARRYALLAHCVSFGINALYEKVDRHGSGRISASGVQRRIAQVDRLAHTVGLDLVQTGWRPTVENYLGRVSKQRILAAVREAKGEPAAQLIDHLKKTEMAKEAERLLADTGWLPEPLRTPDEVDAASEGETLPAFLSGDDGDGEGGEEEAEVPDELAAE